MKTRALVPLALALALLSPLHSSTAAQPNIVIFYADDLGWGEVGCQGFAKDIPTPHIDSLAHNGLRFTNGYVAATYCSPSRAGLMTGRYPTRFGHEFNSVANTIGLRGDQTTIATRLKSLAMPPQPSANGTSATNPRTAPPNAASTNSTARSTTPRSSTRPTS